MPSSWGASEFIASASLIIAFCAMSVAIWAAKEAKRQADAALGEVKPLIFLDSAAFENPQFSTGIGLIKYAQAVQTDRPRRGFGRIFGKFFSGIR